MIPITVSYFLKQSGKSSSSAGNAFAAGSAGIASAPGAPLNVKKGHSPIVLAAVYSSTIALVLAAAGVLLIPFIQAVSRYWATNLVLGGLFVFFALSLFGMYDIVLPSGLGRLTSAGEGRGGLIGVIFMALTFTIISFRLRGPVLRYIDRPVCHNVCWRLGEIHTRRHGLFRDIRLAFLCACAVPCLVEENAQKRLLAEHRQGRDGFP